VKEKVVATLLDTSEEIRHQNVLFDAQIQAFDVENDDDQDVASNGARSDWQDLTQAMVAPC
jgi:hypothetical protein